MFFPASLSGSYRSGVREEGGKEGKEEKGETKMKALPNHSKTKRGVEV
jgi:hypothetical protein